MDNQRALGLILEGQANSAALFDLCRLALGVDQKSCRGFRLSDYHALAGLQSGNADLAGFVCAVNAVAVAD